MTQFADIPGIRIAYTQVAEVECPENIKENISVTSIVNQDGPFIMTHHPIVLMKRQDGVFIECRSFFYWLWRKDEEGEDDRLLSNAPVSLFSTPNNHVALPKHTLFPLRGAVVMQIVNEGVMYPLPGKTLRVFYPGYKIVGR